MKSIRQILLSSSKRVVIKIGSKVLVDPQGVNQKYIQRLVQSIHKLYSAGKEIVVVSSGAVGSGMAVMGHIKRPKEIGQVQACAAVGQLKLMHAYETAFKKKGISMAQILCSADDFRHRERYKNLSNCVESLLAQKIIPVINENDAVAIAEIKVGDNDKLSADVTQFLNADILIIFTDEDGLFDKNPKDHADAKLLHLVEKITPEIMGLAGGSKGSEISTGGMQTKIEALRQATAAGCAAILANGATVLPHQLFAKKEVGTLFLPQSEVASKRSRWLSFVGHPKGQIIIDDGAEHALIHKHKSLLFVGATKIKGSFAAKDLVEIVNSKGKKIGRGVVNFSSIEATSLLGLNSLELQEALHIDTTQELIHKNNLAILA
jgi:glutamate 5-kinase